MYTYQMYRDAYMYVYVCTSLSLSLCIYIYIYMYSVRKGGGQTGTGCPDDSHQHFTILPLNCLFNISNVNIEILREFRNSP